MDYVSEAFNVTGMYPPIHPEPEPEVRNRARQEKPRPMGVLNARELMAKKFPEVRYLVPGYIAEGCTLLAGAPKLGKSWLALDIALAVATGGKALTSIQTAASGDVLYLALEDNERRLQKRMDKLMPFGWQGTDQLHFATTWPRANEGGLDRIKAWARDVPKPTLIIVDVLGAFRPQVTSTANPYAGDYAAVRGLTEISIELGVAVLIIHHTRKSTEGVDPFDRISGTTGLAGASDSNFVLDRDGQGVTLYGRGRDIPEIETAVSFDKDACRWKALGHAAEVHVSDGRKKIIEALKVSPKGEPLTTADLCAITGLTSVDVRQFTSKMHAKGEIDRVGRGLFAYKYHEKEM